MRIDNFRDTMNPMCPTNDGMEDADQLWLLYFPLQHALLRIFGYISCPNNVPLQSPIT